MVSCSDVIWPYVVLPFFWTKNTTVDFTRVNANTHVESGYFGSISYNTVNKETTLKTCSNYSALRRTDLISRPQKHEKSQTIFFLWGAELTTIILYCMGSPSRDLQLRTIGSTLKDKRIQLQMLCMHPPDVTYIQLKSTPLKYKNFQRNISGKY